jgi:Bacterial PH domain
MPASEIPLGSFWFWLVWKLATVFVLAVVPIVAFDDLQFSGPLRFLFVGIIYAVMIVSNEELGYGHASDDGIRYRRYFRRQFLSWRAITSIHWSSRNRVEFRLKQGFLFRKILSTESFGGRLSPDLFSESPEVVCWIVFAKPE